MLARPNRLTRGAEYKAVVRRGRRCAAAHTVTYVSPSGDRPRRPLRLHRQQAGRLRRRPQHRPPSAQGGLRRGAPDSVRPGADIVIRALPERRDRVDSAICATKSRAASHGERHERPAGRSDSATRTSRHPTLLRAVPLLPRNAVLALLHGYRATISHTYGDVCKYYPSCSAYAVGAVQQHGAIKGSALTAARLARCHPWAEGGVDDVPAAPALPVRTDPARVRRACLHWKGLIHRMDLLLAATPRRRPVAVSTSRNHPLAAQVAGRARARRMALRCSPRWGCPPADGITWVLAIVGLVLVVRSALIPLFVKQIKSQRKMMEIAPELRKVQEKYKGKKDQLSREAMSRETMALYKKHGTTPGVELSAAARADADLLRAVQRAERCETSTPRPDIGGVGLLNPELTDGVLQREALRRRVAARHPRSARGRPRHRAGRSRSASCSCSSCS